MRIPKHRAPTSPGEILREEFLKPLGVSQSELARRLGISFPRVNEIVNGKRPITGDTALRLSRLLGTTPDFWLNLQHACDLYKLRNSRTARVIHREVKPLPSIQRTRWSLAPD